MKKNWIYNKSIPEGFEIGHINNTEFSCVGHINDEVVVKKIVDLLNESESKTICNFCGHQNEEICNTCPDLCCGIY